MKEIHYAAARGDIETVLEELRSGADVTHRDTNSPAEFDTSDLSELFEGEEIPDEVNQLLVAAESIDTGDFGEFEATPLICAASDKRADCRMLEVLLDHGADINLMGGAVETSALGAAIGAGPLEKVEFLVSRGASLDCLTKGGGSVWLAAACNHSDSRDAIIDFLLERKAPNLDHVSSHGEHPCIQLSTRGAFSQIAKLIEAGADRGVLRWTDLMWEIVTAQWIPSNRRSRTPISNHATRETGLRFFWPSRLAASTRPGRCSMPARKFMPPTMLNGAPFTMRRKPTSRR